MEEIVKQILISAIELAVQVIEALDKTTIFKKECDEVKIKVQKLLELFELAVISSSNLCEFPTRHIIAIAETLLHKSLTLFEKFIPKLMNRVVTIIRPLTFPNIHVGLESSINDVLWFLNVSVPSKDGEEKFLDLPSFAMNEPILFLIYEQMVILYTGTLDDSCEAAKSLGSMAGNNPRFAEIMIRNGLCSMFAKILEQGSMRAQAEVACTTSLLVTSFPECQNVFAQRGAVQLLLSHLVSRGNNNYALTTSLNHGKTSELGDSLHMKAMAAKALRELAKGNSFICKIITESRIFLRFTDLLEIDDKEVRFDTLMVLKEITAVAEQDSDLRHSAFNSKSLVFKAIVDQIHKLIDEKGDTTLLIPYVALIGNLARAFKASDTQIIEHLVKLLDHQDPEVSREAIVALTKFASPRNYLHKYHSRAIAEAGAAMRLIELSSLGCEIRIPALELLICIAVYVPEKEEVMKVLECASKQPLTK